MTYDEFKAYLAVFLWKQNDTQLIASMDSLILLGTTELDRKLDINEREVSTTLTVVDGSSVALPSDFKHMISVNSGKFLYEKVTEGQILLEVSRNVTNDETPYYSIVGNNLLVGATYADGGSVDLVVTYRNKLPDYATTDASWLADNYLDVYTYTVLKHTAPFLREDERVPLWTALAADALESVLQEDKFNIEFGGSPLKMNMPRQASFGRRPRN